MSRINTNISSLTSIHRLQQNQGDLSLRLQRLSSGLKINTGKDAPAGLIASEKLRSEVTGITAAIDNSQRAGNVVNTAEGALNEVSSLLNEVQRLTSQSANTGGLSSEEISANQLQLDSILASIDRITKTTQFDGVKLLNGALDYTTSGVVTSAFANTTINAVLLPDNGQRQVTVQVLASAKTAELSFTGISVGGAVTTIQIGGNEGTEQISFAANAANSAVAFAINELKGTTGVSAVASAAGIQLGSTAYGSSQFVSVKTITGAFVDGKTTGQDANVQINGLRANADGLTARVRNNDLDISIDLTAAFGRQTTGTKSFYITGGGAKFQVGSSVNQLGQVHLGLGSIASGSLGDGVTGYLSTLGSGGVNSLVSGNTTQAQKIVTEAIGQVANIRGRLGAFQKDILSTNINSLNIALENVTASVSNIRDSDFATETAALARAQVLVQANTAVLAQANTTPQSVLTLLK